jgi:hypothetical protein
MYYLTIKNTTTINSITNKKRLYLDLIFGGILAAILSADKTRNGDGMHFSMYIVPIFLIARIISDILLVVALSFTEYTDDNKKNMKMGNSIVEWSIMFFLYIIYITMNDNNLSDNQQKFAMIYFIGYASLLLYNAEDIVPKSNPRLKKTL